MYHTLGLRQAIADAVRGNRDWLVAAHEYARAHNLHADPTPESPLWTDSTPGSSRLQGRPDEGGWQPYAAKRWDRSAASETESASPLPPWPGLTPFPPAPFRPPPRLPRHGGIAPPTRTPAERVSARRRRDHRHLLDDLEWYRIVGVAARTETAGRQYRTTRQALGEPAWVEGDGDCFYQAMIDTFRRDIRTTLNRPPNVALVRAYVADRLKAAHLDYREGGQPTPALAALLGLDSTVPQIIQTIRTMGVWQNDIGDITAAVVALELGIPATVLGPNNALPIGPADQEPRGYLWYNGIDHYQGVQRREQGPVRRARDLMPVGAVPPDPGLDRRVQVFIADHNTLTTVDYQAALAGAAGNAEAIERLNDARAQFETARLDYPGTRTHDGLSAMLTRYQTLAGLVAEFAPRAPAAPALSDPPHRMDPPLTPTPAQVDALTILGLVTDEGRTDGDSWFDAVIRTATAGQLSGRNQSVVGLTPHRLREQLADRLAEPGHLEFVTRVQGDRPLDEYWAFAGGLRQPEPPAGPMLAALIREAPELLGIRVTVIGPDGRLGRYIDPDVLHLVQVGDHYRPTRPAPAPASSAGGQDPPKPPKSPKPPSPTKEPGSPKSTDPTNPMSAASRDRQRLLRPPGELTREQRNWLATQHRTDRAVPANDDSWFEAVARAAEDRDDTATPVSGPELRHRLAEALQADAAARDRIRGTFGAEEFDLAVNQLATPGANVGPSLGNILRAAPGLLGLDVATILGGGGELRPNRGDTDPLYVLHIGRHYRPAVSPFTGLGALPPGGPVTVISPVAGAQGGLGGYEEMQYRYTPEAQHVVVALDRGNLLVDGQERAPAELLRRLPHRDPGRTLAVVVVGNDVDSAQRFAMALYEAMVAAGDRDPRLVVLPDAGFILRDGDGDAPITITFLGGPSPVVTRRSP